MVLAAPYCSVAQQRLEATVAAAPLELELTADVPVTFWDRFEFSFSARAERIFTDRLHSLNTMNWHFELAARDAEEFRQISAQAASRALSRSLSVSLREATLDLPVMVWLREHRGFFADLVLNSMDSLGEEAVDPLNPSYRPLERSWWRTLAASREFSYGLRPFQTSPYAFVSAGVWRGDSLLMLLHVRYHYRHFSDHQFELAASWPLAHGVSLDVGTAYQFGRNQDLSRMVVKLSKQFDDGGIFHLGIEAQEHPRFIVGLSLPL